MNQFTNRGFDETDVPIGNCSWSGAKGVNRSEHKCTPPVRVVPHPMHPATSSVTIDISDISCLTCLNASRCSTECEGREQGQGIVVSVITQLVAVKDGKVKAWLKA